MINTIYTIGYTGFTIDKFIEKLKKEKINAVIDVRSTPYSRYYTDFNKENLYNVLKKNKIYYKNYAKEFGARQNDLKYYPNGYLDFELFSKSESFLSGINKLQNAMKRNYKFVLMCSEKNPIMCHRAILVSRAFYKLNYDIKHLLPDDKIITQKDIEVYLLDQFLPGRNQINLFFANHTEEEDINEVYRRQNANIGYSIGDEKE